MLRRRFVVLGKLKLVGTAVRLTYLSELMRSDFLQEVTFIKVQLKNVLHFS